MNCFVLFGKKQSKLKKLIYILQQIVNQSQNNIPQANMLQYNTYTILQYDLI
jgi:hypothetical protein